MSLPLRLASLLSLVLAVPLIGREGKLEVVASSAPLASMARRIAGDRARVTCAVPPGKDASLWRPDAKTARAMQKADLVVLNGAGLESWIDLVSLPPSRRVITMRGLESEIQVLDEVITHSHGAEGEHSHQGENPHTWMDPELAARQAAAIAEALSRRDPEGKESFEKGLRALRADLSKLGQELAELTKRHRPVALMVTHPSWAYPAARHGWKLYRVDADTSGSLGEKAKAQVETARGRMPRPALILWESEPSGAIVSELRERGVTSVVLDPGKLQHDDGELDLVERIRDNSAALDAALTEVSGGSR